MDASDVIAVLPAVFSGVKSLVSMLSPRAGVVAGFAETLVAAAVTAERDGLSNEALLQTIGDLYVDMVEKMKTGVP